MKAKLVLDQTQVNPKWSAAKAERARNAGRSYTVPHTIPIKAGSVIDHPDAYMLVKMGNAIPADDDCRLAAGMTPEEMTRAQSRYAIFEKGMGYDEDGNELNYEDITDDDIDDTGDEGTVSDGGEATV